MFLATTALSEFWSKDQEILFLGSWCLRYDRKTDWEGLKYHVLPSPWDDRVRFYEATRYLDDYGERLLNHLTSYLNAAHGVTYDQRYWRILIGPWLLHYLHAVYDRYIHLEEAFTRYPRLQTLALDASSFFTPQDTMELVYFVINDHYNLQLFSQLIQAMGHVCPVQSLHEKTLHEKSFGNKKEIWKKVSPLESLSTMAARAVSESLRRLMQSRWRAGLYKMGLERRLMWSIAWRIGLQVIPMEVKTTWPFASLRLTFDQRRNNLASLPVSNQFERVFVKTLPQNFPTLYLENYHKARNAALRNTQLPRVIVSAVGWYFDEPFKFIAAEASARGGKLVAVQHGGGYGIFRFSMAERHELRVADSFMVWGWADKATQNCRNLPSPRLSSLSTPKSTNAGSGEEDILFVAMTHPRYLYRFHSTPVGTQWEGYFDWELRFLSALSDRHRQAVLFRPYPHDYGHAVRERLGGRFPGLRWDHDTSFAQRVQSSRVVVFDHCSTGFLEALCANVPTICFWDPHRWEVREEAEPYFEDLRKVGILWDEPEAAAKKAAEVYDDPRSWWNSGAVQETRQRFADRYALGREDWMDCWVKALNEEVALSRVRVE